MMQNVDARDKRGQDDRGAFAGGRLCRRL